MLRRADVFVLRMIRDSWPERPIYFARSAVGYPRSLGLGDNVLTQGLATKLFVPTTTSAMPHDTMFVQGDGWLDVGAIAGAVVGRVPRTSIGRRRRAVGRSAVGGHCR